MGTIISGKINKFDGGMVNTIRGSRTDVASTIQHFDVFKDPNKMIPFRGNIADGSTGDTEKLVQFQMGSDDKQYALGVVSGSSKVKVFERTPPTGIWGASTTGEDSAGLRSETAFINYKDVLYGFAQGNRVWSYAYLTNTFTATAKSLASTYTLENVAQGVVHTKDDILYMAYENFIISKDGGGAFTDPALTLPSDQIITSICEYGNYLAIAAKSRILGGNSVVYLWNRDDSLTTLSEKIDWGTGSIEIIQELEGALIGVSTSTASTVVFTPSIIFRSYIGVGAIRFAEFPMSSNTNIFAGIQRADNRILFGLSLPYNSVNLDGIWSIGKSVGGGFGVSLDTLITSTPATLANRIKGFQLLGDYMTIAYLDDDADGDPYKIVRTGTTENFNSIYETTINQAMKELRDSSIVKKLIGVTIHHEFLPSGASATVKIRKNEETTYGTTVITSDTDDDISKDAILDSTGANLPEFKELQFQVSSTGGAVITGLSFKVEEVDRKRY